MERTGISSEAVRGQLVYGSFPRISETQEAARMLWLRSCHGVVSAEDGNVRQSGKPAHPVPAELRRDRLVPVADSKSFTAAFLVVDVRSWGKIVHDLGPDPAPAAKVIQHFWDSTAPVVMESGGQVYAWRGDGLLVAYQGKRRMERALKAAECLLTVVRDELAPGFQAQLRAANARTIQFAVSAAITDGKAVPVPVRFGLQNSEELTGDWVNAAFEMVKWAAAGTVSITWEICRWLAENNPASLGAFSWHEPKEVLLAGAVRHVLQGIPTAVGLGWPGGDPPSPGD